MSWYGDWKPYVPVAKRRAKAARFASMLAKKEGRRLAPIKITGRKMAATFWGNAWCENLERYSDFANRLPRGRTYARNGSVIDLQISRGQVSAIVSGSEIYQIKVQIKTLSPTAWKQIKQDCSRSFGSLIDLLQGRFDTGVMERLTQKQGGLFPEPKEISLSCSCPDYAGLCKHVAATLYGVGSRLDTQPELLFTLRDVDHLELIEQAITGDNLNQSLQADTDPALAGADLGELFGIELDSGGAQKTLSTRNPLRTTKSVLGKTATQAKAAAKVKAAKSTSGKANRTVRKQPSPKSPHALLAAALVQPDAKLIGSGMERGAVQPAAASQKQRRGASSTNPQAVSKGNAVARVKVANRIATTTNRVVREQAAAKQPRAPMAVATGQPTTNKNARRKSATTKPTVVKRRASQNQAAAGKKRTAAGKKRTAATAP